MANSGADEEKILRSLMITSDIRTEMTRQAALYAQMAIASAHAKNIVEHKKMALEMLEADLDTAARRAIVSSGEKLREAAVEAEMKKNPDWVNMYNSLLEDRLELGIVEAATEAFRQRAMMLSGLGAMQRTEMEQEQVMNTKVISGKATELLTRKFERSKGQTR